MNAPLYTTEILRLAASLEPFRPLGREDGRAEVRSPTCGSRVSTSVELDSSGKIAALSQQVHACAFGQASAALVARGAPGRSGDEVQQALTDLEAWLAGSNQLPSWSGTSSLAPARSRKSRHGAILLPYRALLAAVESAR